MDAQSPGEQGLKGADIYMDLVTVGGTENLMMAACLAQGTTRLYNAACEPVIIDLAFLSCSGRAGQWSRHSEWPRAGRIGWLPISDHAGSY